MKNFEDNNDIYDDYYDDYDDDHPCKTCHVSDTCDGWEARFCCDLCNYMGGGDCENCDPMDL